MNAYVLVGGRSRRMGESKVELFLDRVVSAARPVFDEVMVVDRLAVGSWRVAGGHLPSTLLPPTANRQPPTIRTIYEDPHEHEGPIFGVVCALRDARAKCFLLAVDYPLITSDVLRFIRDREGMPEWNGRPQTLCAVWDAALLPRIEERIARGALDLRGAAETEIIPESELRARFPGEPLLNVNTPEEWERAQRFLASR